MNEARYQQLLEISRRRLLTDAELDELEAHWSAHPASRASGELEAGLDRLLHGELKDVPVPSNFTARVMQAIDRDAARTERARAPRWSFWHRPVLRGAAVATVVVLASFTAFLHYHQAKTQERSEVARDVALVSSVAAVPSPEVLADFDAISRLSVATPDDELLAMLK